MKVIINTIRTSLQGEVIKGGKKLTDRYKEEAAYCLLNPDDAASIGVKEGNNVLLKSADGEVILRVRVTADMQRGGIVIPLGPWANLIIDAYTFNTGSPYYKGNVGEVEKTDRRVKSVVEIMMLYMK